MVGAACAAAGGAYFVVTPQPAIVGIALICLAARSVRLAVLLAILVCAGVLAGRSIAGLTPLVEREVTGRVSLVADPEWVAGAMRVDVRLEGRRYEAWARGTPAFVLESMLSGESLEVAATVRPFDDEWLPRRARHVVGQLDIDVAWNAAGATGMAGFANSLRRSVVAGAQSLSQRDRVLLAGFSVGDDRQQLPEVTDDFRAAGLTHLTAVSGQNVAFVLLPFGPLLRRLSPRGRAVVTVMVLVQFGLITRWEPSVMRAITLAVAASIGQLYEGTTSGLRMLGFVVTLLILVDPMLVHSVGFTLSVMASVGIALFSAPLGRRLPGPRWIAEPLALTMAAQLGVASILVATFGSIPLVSIPANMAAGPASGPLMAWGLAIGPVAGQLPDVVAAVVHIPTRLLTGYVALVARASSAVDGPELGVAALVFLGIVAVVVWLLRGQMRWWVLVMALALCWIFARWRTSTSEGPASSPRTVRWPWSSTVLGPNGFCPGFDEPGSTRSTL